MEKFVFIHGSSVGQSILIPPGSPDTICRDIADKYFRGRELRIRESATKCGLFVELYQDSYGRFHCVYSFVNNDCNGSNGRPGQYIAISIVCCGIYVYAEGVYNMLSQAYRQMVEAKKILSKDLQTGNDCFVIPQFETEYGYLTKFCAKIGEAFESITSNNSRPLPLGICFADYETWRGGRECNDTCNSLSAFTRLCNEGRLYISDQYDTPEKKLQKLEEQVRQLQIEKAELERRGDERRRAAASMNAREVENLNNELRRKDAAIADLEAENQEYKSTIAAVRSQLERYARAGHALTDVRVAATQYKDKDKRNLLKICLLVLILLFTTIGGVMNYAFFRNLTSNPQQPTTIQSREDNTEEQLAQEVGGDVDAEATTIVASPTYFDFDAAGGKSYCTIEADGEWRKPDAPTSAPWLSISKINEKTLKLTATPNTGTESRSTIFTLGSQQISVNQKGVAESTPAAVDYGLVVKDSNGRILTNNSIVHPGQKVEAEAKKPSKNHDGYGWKYSNCTGREGNLRSVKVTIGNDTNKPAIIAYGQLGDGKPRQKINLIVQKEPDAISEEENSKPSDSLQNLKIQKEPVAVSEEENLHTNDSLKNRITNPAIR